MSATISVGSSPDNPLKVILLGDCPGKSCFVVRLVQNYFIEQWDPTIDEWYQYKLGDVYLDILDSTSGSEYDEMNKLNAKTCHVALVMLNVTDRSQFEEVDRLVGLTKHDCSGLPFVLVGTNSDRTNREVTIEEAQALADAYGVPYIETSAKTGQGVREAFEEAINQARTATNENDVQDEPPSTRSQHCTLQ